jgi:putative hydrolase of HD superfamily
MSEAAALARFLNLAGALKRTPRTGWLDRGLPPEETESVADHTFRTALLAWLLAAADPSFDRARVLELALVHDLAEAITGDVTPYDREALPAENATAFLDQRHLPSPERAAAKQAAEAAAIASLIVELPDGLTALIRDRWREATQKATPEAQLVKAADRLETYLQSREYAARNPDLPVASFAAEVAETIDDPALIALRDAIERLAMSDEPPAVG